MKTRLKHINVRLTDGDREALQRRAECEGLTVSDTVRALLFDITHYLQMRGQPQPSLMLRYHTRGSCTSRLDVKVPAQICEYLALNGYNLTTCLLYKLYGN